MISDYRNVMEDIFLELTREWSNESSNVARRRFILNKQSEIFEKRLAGIRDELEALHWAHDYSDQHILNSLKSIYHNKLKEKGLLLDYNDYINCYNQLRKDIELYFGIEVNECE